MKSRLFLLGLVLLAVLVGGWALTRRSDVGRQKSETASPTVTPDPGLPTKDSRTVPKPAPEFSRQALDGTTVSVADFQNQRAVLINAWAVWCPFCVDELVDFAKLAEEFPDDIVILAVNRAEPEGVQRPYLENVKGQNLLQSRLRFLVDPDDAVYQVLGGFGMPVTMFVSKEGQVAFVKSGPMELDEMRALVKTHFGVGK